VVQVTVDTNGGHREWLTTFRGAKPGDALQAGTPLDPDNRSGATSRMTAHMPLDAYNGRVMFECGAAAGDLPPNGIQYLQFYESCRSSTFDIFMLLDVNGTLEYAWQPGVTYLADDDINVSDDLQLLAQSTTTFKNVPSNLTRVFVTEYMLLGSSMSEFDRQGVDTPSAGDHAVSLRYAPNAWNGTLLHASEVTGIQTRQQYATVTFGTPNVDIDLATLPLPTITSRTQQATGVKWNEAPQGSPDARFVLWNGQWTDASNVQHSAFWTFIEDPATPGPSMMPALPDMYGADDPSKASGPSLFGATVEYVDYDNLNGYDAARPLGQVLMYVDRALRNVEHHAHSTWSP
jgi:hypothetical protein